ncbi:hypothetical protein HK098_003267 [Nowakowskiella sp. JEL0407]|nr:hypothetical protein HK098_003267 [Nowakowskiella sp. JEL0407]
MILERENSKKIDATWVPIFVDSESSDAIVAPSPRVGHTLTFVPNLSGKECILLFGGANHEEGTKDDLWIFDITKKIWESKATSNKPAPRYEHCASLVKRNGESMLFVFGGSSGDSVLNDVWLLKLDVFTWSKLETKGKAPSARTIHSCAHFNVKYSNDMRDRIYVFAGGTAGDIPVSDLGVYCLDLNSGLWIQVADSPSRNSSLYPNFLLGHSIVATENQMVVFGGMSGEMDLADLWIFDIDKKNWERPEVKGDLPPARSGHMAKLVSSNKMLIFGGMQRIPNPSLFDDVYCLNLDTLTWTKWDIAVELPGGPGRRLDMDGCVISSSKLESKSLVIFGGMDFQGMYNDLYELECEH